MAATAGHVSKLAQLRTEISLAREDWEEAVFLVDHFPQCRGYWASLHEARRALERAEARYERMLDREDAW